MDRDQTYIFTHFTDIADAKSDDIRNLQTEAVRGIVRAASRALHSMMKRSGLIPGISQGDLS